jgi:type IV pilus assembly protein PilE
MVSIGCMSLSQTKTSTKATYTHRFTSASPRTTAMNAKPISRSKGFNLVELMICVAIIGILGAVAIPAYNGYITTSKQRVMDQNMGSLRIFLEDFFLDNDTYLAGTYMPGGTDTLTTQLGWRPDGDNDRFKYVVASCDSGTIGTCYKITVTYLDKDKKPLSHPEPIIFEKQPAP